MRGASHVPVLANINGFNFLFLSGPNIWTFFLIQVKNRKWKEIDAACFAATYITSRTSNSSKALERSTMPSIYYPKRSYFFTYVRYADDWIILSNAKQAFLNEIKNLISSWLSNNLGLTLSPDKTFVTNLIEEKAKFLGFTINTYRKRNLVKDSTKQLVKTAGWNLLYNIDTERVLPRFVLRGFCRKKAPYCQRPFYCLNSRRNCIQV